MGAAPIIIALPFFDSLTNFRRTWILPSLEFLKIRHLRALDLAVQMRRARRDGSKLNHVIGKPSLYFRVKEFTPSVCLNTLNWKRHLLRLRGPGNPGCLPRYRAAVTLYRVESSHLAQGRHARRFENLLDARD